jgi:hypothetical protein
MYRVAGKGFSEVLEELDPSRGYDAEFSNMDAYQRQLKRFDIKVRDVNADCIEKFFRTAQTATLFPEYVFRAVKAGAESVTALGDITAIKTQINGVDYRTIYGDDKTEQEETINEGVEIPSVNVRLKENLVKLNKSGQMLVASYEAVRNQKIELFTIMLKQVGARIAKQQFKSAVEVLVNGDEIIKSDVQTIEGDLAFEQLINLWNDFDDEYKMSTILVSSEMMKQLLQLPEVMDAKSGFKFEIKNDAMMLLGAQLIKSNLVPKDLMIALDKRFALEMVCSGDISIEHDKLIDKQLERSTIVSTYGFTRICKPAVKILKFTATE